MSPLRRSSLAWIAGLVAIGLLVGRVLPTVVVRLDGVVPRVSWAAPLVLFAAAAAVGVLAYRTWQSLHRKRQRMTSQYGVTLLAVAKSGTVVGALVGGFYAGFSLAYLDALDTVLGQERAIRAAVAAVACLLLLIASQLLERACVLPSDDDDDDERESGAEPA